MKFSLNLGQYYSNVDLKSIDHGDIVRHIGAQLGAIEEVVDWAPKYRGIVVAKVASCEKHPDADKLSLCLIDDAGVTENVDRDSNGLVQVVCGADNVAEGQLVAWIPPGATVPSTVDKEPFVLEVRELRGKVSNGMIASPKELDISDEHDGILVIDPEGEGKPEPGQPLAKFFGLDDFVVDCENKMFTHRPDCFGNLGIARELGGIFGMKFKSPEWYTNPVDWSQKPKAESQIQIQVENKIPDLVPRFTVVVMDNITIGPSATWMQGYLKRVGIKPINNVVDVTNYVMHLTGQPLHAFDYDKLLERSSEPSLYPRMAKKGEKLLLLGEKEIELNESDIVIATDKQAVALAGVMGGAETEVGTNTKRIAIECANFDMYAIRRTSMRHGLFTDAVTRFNKGQSPLQNDRVLARAMHYFEVMSGAIQASEVYDLHNFDLGADNLSHVTVGVDFINDRLGSSLTAEQIKELLENVEFTVSFQGRTLEITVPFWRMDISIGEDIVEEVGRLYGYDRLPVALPHRSSKPTPINKTRQFSRKLARELSSAGANEVLTYSFVHGNLVQNMGTDPEKWAYHIRNALSPDLQYYRTSLLPSLLNKVHGNIKAQAGSNENEFALFEIGKAHVKGHQQENEPELPAQMRRLALVVAADSKTAKQHAGSAYYQAKKYLDLVTAGQASYHPLESTEYPMTAPYQNKRSAMVKVNGQVLGVIGEFHAKAKKSLKLPDYSAGFELDVDLLMANLATTSYSPLSTFPSSNQDITFEVPSDFKWAKLHSFVHAELAVAHAESGYQYELEPLDIFQAEGADKKRISLRVTLSHPQKTLKTEEVNKLLEQIAKVADEKLQALRI